VKPLDSNDAALVAATSELDESSNARRVPFVTDSADAEVPTPRARSEVVAASAASAAAGARISRVVPWGTTEDDEASDDLDSPPLLPPISTRPSVAVLAATADADAAPAPAPARTSTSAPAPRYSDVVPRDTRALGTNESSPSAPEVRAAARIAFVATRIGPGFDADDEEDEATTVDAGAALSADEREALGRRVHSVMGETQPVGTPSPGPVEAFDEGFAEAARDRRNAFKQTMLLGLPKVESPVPPATISTPTAVSPAPSPVARVLMTPVSAMEAPVALASSEHSGAEEESAGPTTAPGAPETTASTEPALMASVVRVVGPPTQPPPRRSRRIGGIASPEPSEPDHEAFVLTNAITPDLSRRSAVPAVPPRGPRVDTSASINSNRVAVAASRASLPGVMLPPAPMHPELEPTSFPSMVTPAPSLRATIEPPMSSLARTRPPSSQRMIASDPELAGLPDADPFAGFVAPAPSAAQRWLVVVVVALAVVGLCSLAAIALGLLGKTGW
jgi:hypothetical protein